MFEDFIGAMQNFNAKKLRTALSLMGIAIGVSAVVIITNLGASLYESVVSQIGTAGLDIIMVRPRWNAKKEQLFFKLDNQYRKQMLKSISGVKEVFYTSTISAIISSDSANTGMQQITGIEPQFLTTVSGIELEYGSPFTLSDYADHRRKVIIGSKLAQDLFPEGNPIGKQITLGLPYSVGRRQGVLPFIFEVSAVISQKQGIFAQNTLYSVYVPRTFITQELGMSQSADDCFVQIANMHDFALLKQKITAFTEAYVQSQEENILNVHANYEDYQTFNQGFAIMSATLTVIAAVSLAVGGINIMNMMLVTVTERKREIGIRKALGATRGDITKQFLTEAALLSLTGGIIGVLFGSFITYVGITFLVPDKYLMQYIQSGSGAAISFFVSVGIGLFFGLSPARKAARLDPVVALTE